MERYYQMTKKTTGGDILKTSKNKRMIPDHFFQSRKLSDGAY
jgi:hypothetical protein